MPPTLGPGRGTRGRKNATQSCRSGRCRMASHARRPAAPLRSRNSDPRGIRSPPVLDQSPRRGIALFAAPVLRPKNPSRILAPRFPSGVASRPGATVGCGLHVSIPTMFSTTTEPGRRRRSGERRAASGEIPTTGISSHFFPATATSNRSHPSSRHPLPATLSSLATRYPLPATRYPLPAAATRYLLPATRFPPPATRYLLPATRYPPPATLPRPTVPKATLVLF